MKHWLALGTALALASSAAIAQPCGERVVALLSSGDLKATAELFEPADAQTRAGLRAIVEKMGPVTQWAVAQSSSFSTYRRQSALGAGLPKAYTSDSWLYSGRSGKLGKVELQVLVKPGTACSVLALHLRYLAR